MRNGFAAIICTLALAAAAAGQTIRVHPTGVNVNTQNATTVFLTFGGLTPNYAPSEAFWCGALIPARPDIGVKCDPTTLFGSLPLRYDLSTQRGGSFSDIMSIPPSVARRAYQAAASGDDSAFYYVRRFAGTNGSPDQYVAVTCRMTGGGARTPFALTEVRLAFDSQKLVWFGRAGERPAPIRVEIAYNGTGRLRGRWEVVQPGDPLPEPRDLLPEGSLPMEERYYQKRYTQIARFNVFLPPAGRFVLDGPDVARLPSTIEGLYQVLLRIEAVEDKEADSNLAAAGAGVGIVSSGGAAGFALPPLRYFIGSGEPDQSAGPVVLIAPFADARIAPGKSIEFVWSADAPAGSFYRLDVEGGDKQPVLSALTRPGIGVYRAPTWLPERLPDGKFRWRVVVLDGAGGEVGQSSWRNASLEQAAVPAKSR